MLNRLLGDLDGVATNLHPDRTIVRVDAFDAVLEFVDIVKERSAKNDVA